MAVHKYNMGVIGNCSYMAYIDMNADVTWMCMPRFDSSFLFGSLLDEKKGGHFRIRPANEGYTSRQYYISNTNILCTEFSGPEGSFRVVDCAPRMTIHERNFRPYMLIRKIELISGTPIVKTSCLPVDRYGELQPQVATGSNHISYLNLSSLVRLTTDIPINYVLQNQGFLLDQHHYMVLTYGEPLEAPLADTADRFIKKTTEYWQNWIKHCHLPGIYQEQVIRSALILKLHQYEDTGGIIASGTTSLPEHDTGMRNWDYRYCWFRDAYYTLKAINQLGHFEELEKYFDFVQNILENAGETLQPLYSITGEARLNEIELELNGYLNNKPVRVGNKAYEQIQNDVYGQVLVSLLPLYTDNRLTFARKESYRRIVPWLLDKIERTLNSEDAGLWEFREIKQSHAYSVLFHWAGAMSARKIAKKYKDDSLFEKADRIAEDARVLLEKFYDNNQKMFVQAMGTEHLDASTLMLITMGFLEPDSQRAADHIKALETGLLTSQGLFYRYRHQDDFGIPQTTFLVCAFWYVDALACVGRVEDAQKVLENILQFSNHLGIFSEDVGEDGSQWGNFPQTYSHVGLINAVFRISNKLDRAEFLED